jgi:hypothetical protein
MTSSVSPKGNVPHCNCSSQYTTTYAHDPYGNLTTVTDPLSHQTIRHYDADQNLDSFQDGDQDHLHLRSRQRADPGPAAGHDHADD